MATAVCRGKPSGSSLINTDVASWGQLGIAKNLTQLLFIAPRWRKKTSWTRWRSMTSFRDPLLRRMGVVSFAPGGSQSTKGSDDAPQLRARWVAQEFRGRYGDKHEYFSETSHLTSVTAVIEHAARRAESEDIVVAVLTFGERNSTLKRRGTLLLSCWTMHLLDSGRHTLGSCAKRCTEDAQLRRRGGMR